MQQKGVLAAVGLAIAGLVGVALWLATSGDDAPPLDTAPATDSAIASAGWAESPKAASSTP